jgi:D-amino-acid dehydrogenase
MKVVIIGGGIIGLCSAYFLNKSGHQVEVLDQGDLSDGCSWGNAGMVVPSHFIPMAAPGMISKGIRWMFDPESPFYIRPRLDRDLLRWGYLFYKNATRDHVDRSLPVLKQISLLSKALYGSLSNELPFDFGYQERGLLMLYQTAAVEREEIETAHVANQHGIVARVLTETEVQQLEPGVRVKARGGIYFPGDAHLTPQALVSQLIPYLKAKGVVFHPATAVSDFIVEGTGARSVITNKGDFSFDQLIIAAGSWSGRLGAKLKFRIPMQAGKGYSFMAPVVNRDIRIPSILVEARVAVTPMGEAIRFGGTMEITGNDTTVRMNRVKGIVDSIPLYYPELNVALPKQEAVWCGLRPCSPDGLPYIGRLTPLQNVIVATGHAMMGLSLGPATGKLVAEIVNEEKTSMDIQPFNPRRFT